MKRCQEALGVGSGRWLPQVVSIQHFILSKRENSEAKSQLLTKVLFSAWKASITGSPSICACFSRASFSSAFMAGVLVSPCLLSVSVRPGIRPESRAWAASDTVGAPRSSLGSFDRDFSASKPLANQRGTRRRSIATHMNDSKTSGIPSETGLVVRSRTDHICSLYFISQLGSMSAQELE